MSTERAVHPVAAMFPMMSDDELAELVASIKANGLLNPIITDRDGRNRYAACKAAKVEPRFEVYDGDPAVYALAANLARRSLTKGQKAMITAKALWPVTGQSLRAAEQATGIAHQRISEAATVLQYAAHQADAVIIGKIGLDEAVAEARRNKKQSEQRDQDLELLLRDTPDLHDKVLGGVITVSEAMTQRMALIQNAHSAVHHITQALDDFARAPSRLKATSAALALAARTGKPLPPVDLAELTGSITEAIGDLKKQLDELDEPGDPDA